MQLVEIFPYGRQGPIYTALTLVADALEMQGTRTLADMVLTKLSWNIPDEQKLP